MPWTTITNAQLAVGAPIRSVDLLALRDNTTAQANGDAGSPQQQTAGIADNAVTAAKVNKGNGIGTSGTQLVIVCPTWGTVGSDACGVGTSTGNSGGGYPVDPTLLTVGTNYSAAAAGIGGASGTWKCMGRTGANYSFYSATISCNPVFGIFVYQWIYLFCRVS